MITDERWQGRDFSDYLDVDPVAVAVLPQKRYRVGGWQGVWAAGRGAAEWAGRLGVQDLRSGQRRSKRRRLTST